MNATLPNAISSTLCASIIKEVNELDGWTTPERAIEMAGLVVEHKPEICVEIGVFGGRSLIPTALALRENRHGTVFGIDPWKTEAALEAENEANKSWWQNNVNLDEIHTKTMRAIWRLELDPWAVIIRARSEHVPMLFGMVDWLLIDGNHSEVASCRDVKLYLPMVSSGGIVVMDDLDWPTTRKAGEMIEAECDRIGGDGHYGIFVKR